MKAGMYINLHYIIFLKHTTFLRRFTEFIRIKTVQKHLKITVT